MVHVILFVVFLVGGCVKNTNTIDNEVVHATTIEELSLWTLEEQQQILQSIHMAKQSDNVHVPYAVFDADNTLWKYDIAEGLLVWMASKNKIQLPAVGTESRDVYPVPLTSEDTLFGYYEKLSAIDHSLAYLWSAQIFAGYNLATLRMEVQAMMASSESMVATLPNGQSKQISPPKVYPAQQQLVQYLQQNGIEVWVVSASVEDIVRMVVSDPQYGLSIPPERVIGVNLALYDQEGQLHISAMDREEGKTGLGYFFGEERSTWVLGTYPFAPMTWYAGKVAAIQQWIHPAQRPILVAGDSPNDFYMQHYVERSYGIKLRIRIKESHTQALAEFQSRLSSDPSWKQRWVEKTPAELGIP